LGSWSQPASAGVAFLEGGPGEAVRLVRPNAAGEDTPVLVVVTGGADLDATGAGDLTGVLVVDGGGVHLEGTRLHGAAVCSGVADLGATGTIDFSLPVFRWATDRSLRLTRLVPGTVTQPAPAG
jgi:hypothetical protein